jgi:rod shape-determining protein MreC
MEYSPPPLFKQGASARAKVVFFSLLALALLSVDSRVRSLTMIRQVIGTALYPLQMVALMPRDAVVAIDEYFTSVSTLERENKRLKQQQTLNAETLQQSQQLYAENAQLRKLLGASARVPLKSLMAEILYDTRDAFTRKIVLNRGSESGVAPGQPVIDDVGVVGQVTRVFPFTSEVTLLTDKDQAIPVQVVRSGLRSVAYGRGQTGGLELRFMATNADIQKGDLLTTSGIDGVYPAGLAVAKVVQVETKSTATFAHIVCQPSAGIDRNRQLLILLADTNLPPRPEEESKEKKDKFAKHHGHEAGKETSKEPLKSAPAPVAAKEPSKPEPAPAAPKETSKVAPTHTAVPKEPSKAAPAPAAAPKEPSKAAPIPTATPKEPSRPAPTPPAQKEPVKSGPTQSGSSK